MDVFLFLTETQMKLNMFQSTSNANTEAEQVQGLSKLIEFSKNIHFFEKNRIVSADNLHVFFGSKLETKEGKHSLKQKSAGKPLELKEEYVLCVIWRIQNP